jgi:hypothetical protein
MYELFMSGVNNDGHSWVAFGEVETIEHMIFIIELDRFGNIKTHALINCDNAIELSHKWMLAAKICRQKLWELTVNVARRANV